MSRSIVSGLRRATVFASIFACSLAGFACSGGSGGTGGTSSPSTAGGGNGSSSSSSSSSGSSSTSSSFSCCLNDVHYTCPSDSAAQKCAGFSPTGFTTPDPSVCTKQTDACPPTNSGSSSGSSGDTGSSGSSGSSGSDTCPSRPASGPRQPSGGSCTIDDDCCSNDCVPGYNTCK